MAPRFGEIMWWTVLAVIAGIIYLAGPKQRDEAAPAPDPSRPVNLDNVDHDSAVLVFAGDAICHNALREEAWLRARDGRGAAGPARFDFHPVLEGLDSVLASADFAVVNLESPIGKPPYRGFPFFSAPLDFARDLRRAGFGVAAMANNHALDNGPAGVRWSLGVLDSLGWQTTGVFRDPSDRTLRNPLILESKGFKIALCSYTWWDAPTPRAVRLNILSRDSLLADAVSARAQGADFVVAVLHWGREYDSKPSRSQEDLAARLAEAGFDAIVGSHPHVLQSFRWVHRSTADSIPVWFSLGNLVSHQKGRSREVGALARIRLSRGNGGPVLASAATLPTYVHQWTDGGIRHHRLLLSGRAAVVDPDSATRERSRAAWRSARTTLEGTVDPKMSVGMQWEEGGR